MSLDARATARLGPARGDLRVELRWFEPSSGVDLAADADVYVFLHVPDVGGDRDASVVAPWLSEAERARRDRIVHPRALAEFLAGRRMLRSLMAPLVGARPESVGVVESERGALTLDPRAHGAKWCFNISHTDGLVALAIARAPIGVDVEWLARPGRTVELAERYFAPAEVAALRALPEARRRDRFFDLWTLKEAYIKARGLGLAIPLDSFAFSLEHDAVAIAIAPEANEAPGARWRFHLTDVGTSHRLAIAACAPRR